MPSIDVDFGDSVARCKVVESFGYIHSIGFHAKAVVNPATGDEVKVVKRGGRWTPWGAADKWRILVESMEQAARRRARGAP